MNWRRLLLSGGAAIGGVAAYNLLARRSGNLELAPDAVVLPDSAGRIAAILRCNAGRTSYPPSSAPDPVVGRTYVERPAPATPTPGGLITTDLDSWKRAESGAPALTNPGITGWSNNLPSLTLTTYRYASGDEVQVLVPDKSPDNGPPV